MMTVGDNEDFQKRLLATFSVEAEEHLEAISAGLLELERETTEDSLSLIESTYREVHSLKGAARAVGISDIELLCQALESIFAAAKRGRLKLTSEAFDIVHRTLDLINSLLAGTEVSTAQLSSAVEQLSVVESSATEEPAEPSHAVIELSSYGNGSNGSRQPAEVSPPPALTELKADPSQSSKRDETPVNRQSRPAAQRKETATSSLERLPASQTVRISTAKLDALMLQSEELVSLKLKMDQLATDLRGLHLFVGDWKKQCFKPESNESATRPKSSNKNGSSTQLAVSAGASESLDWNRSQVSLLEGRLWELASMADRERRHFGGMVDGLLDNVKAVLMQPFSSLLRSFPKLVRDLSREQGKHVELSIVGGNIEIDRRILEGLKDPLIHMVRNSIDHGIEHPDQRLAAGKNEKATLAITVSQMASNMVEIIVSDDGGGVDPIKVKQAAINRRIVSREVADQLDAQGAIELIFQSEVSTSSIITDLSGRGLGLAIVRERVEKLGGTVSIESERGVGVAFRLRLPLTLASFRGVLVRVGEQILVVPATNVERVVRINKTEVKTVNGQQCFGLNGRVVGLINLRDVLNIERQQVGEPSRFLVAVIISAEARQLAFVVDEVLNEQEVLVKSLGKHLIRVRHVAGATVLSSGRVAPILNPTDLMKTAIRRGGIASREPVEKEKTQARKSILIAEDSITSRMLLKNILESAGYSVKTAVDGLDAFTALASEQFDLVVSDIEMPRMNGLDLTSKIRSDKRMADTPVVLVTSLGSREDRERGIDVGANAYIVKSSFDQGNLLEVVRRLA